MSLYIFRSLNSSGLKLTDLDLVKGYMFQILQDTYDDRNQIYNLWQSIVNNCALTRATDESALTKNRNSVNTFFKIYANIEGLVTALETSYFSGIKNQFKSANNLNEVISMLKLYSTLYKSLRTKNFDEYNCFSKKVKKKLAQYASIVLNFKGNQFASYLPAIFGMYWFRQITTNIYTDTQILSMIDALVSMHLRYEISKGGSKGKNNAFYVQLKTKLKQALEEDKFSELPRLLKQCLKEYRIEDATILHNKFNPKDIFTVFILKKINPAWKDLILDDCTIQHIMPRNRDNWKNIPVSITSDEYREMIQQIGNLVLIPRKLNSKLSNKSFQQKLNILTEYQNGLYKDVYKDVYYDTNGNCKLEWTLEDITLRTEKIKNQFNQVFPMMQD